MKILFIDRDGTLIREPADEQVDRFEKLEFMPGVFQWLKKLVDTGEFELVMVSNQDGLGTASFPEPTFWPVQEFIITAFKNEGILFKDVLIDRSFPHEQKPTRKPCTGLLTGYLQNDLSSSWVIGDRETDQQLARNLGCRSFTISREQTWEDCYRTITERKVTLERNTNETSVSVAINLDGTGKAAISTGIGFFDHMLEQVARHSGIDLIIKTIGDLHVDEHHTIEDTAITLGEAMDKALGNKRGIERYSFLLPMDDAITRMALDLGGRPYLTWKVPLIQSRLGEMPSEMFRHFFYSFCIAARCTLFIESAGENDHHKIESVFKAFAKCLKNAVARHQQHNELPTTKGIV